MSIKPECAPLCGASQAYGRFDKPWYHEQQCPVRIEWEKKRAVSPQERVGNDTAQMSQSD